MFKHARTLTGLYAAAPSHELLVPAGTVGIIRRVIEQEGSEYPDLEVEYPNGVVEQSPADTFEPVEGDPR